MSASVLTECVEAQSEGGLVGCCGMIGDEVWVEERGAGKRSVTGGVRAEVSPVAPTRSLRPEKKKGEFITAKTPFSLFFFSCPLRPFPCLGSPSLFCVRVCPPNCVSPFHSSSHALLYESVLRFRCEPNDEEVPAP